MQARLQFMGVSRRNRVLALIAGGVMLVFGLLVVFLWWSSLLPPLVLPARIPPQPNAFDTLAQAHKKSVKKVGTASILGTYISAKGSAKSYMDFGTLMDRAALVRENEETIRLIRVALTEEYLAPITFRVDQQLPHYATYKELCRVLLAAARLAFDAKEWSVGAAYCCEAIQLGQLISTNEYMLGRLVGLGCESLSRRLLCENVTKFSYDALRTTYDRLSAIESRREHLSVAIENERIAYQATVRALANRTPHEISRITGSDDQNAWLIMFTSKRSAAAAGDTYFAQAMRIAREPYDKTTVNIPEPGDPISDAAMRNMSYFIFRDVLQHTERTLLLAYLYVRLNPTSKLPAMFVDPFGKGRPLRYLKTGSKFTLYSVGPDGVDDRGAKLSNGSGHSTEARESSTGDLVWPLRRPPDSDDL